MTTIIAPYCYDCIHFEGDEDGKATCKAFPLGIPDTIYWYHRKHVKPRKDQVGKFIFQRKPMSGSELYEFYSERCFQHRVIIQREKRMFEYWGMFTLAAGREVCQIQNELKRWQDQSLDLLAVYPGIGEKAPEDAEYIGNISDGALYYVKSKYSTR